MLSNARRNRAALAALLAFLLTVGVGGLFGKFADGAPWTRAVLICMPLPLWVASMAIADRLMGRLAPIDKQDRPRPASSGLDDPVRAPGESPRVGWPG